MEGLEIGKDHQANGQLIRALLLSAKHRHAKSKLEMAAGCKPAMVP
jgi:hypothetical protein